MAEKLLYGKKTSFTLLSALVVLAFLISASSLSFATTNVIYAGIDKNSYLPGENITLSGMVYSGETPADGEARIIVLNSTGDSVYDSVVNVTSGVLSAVFAAHSVVGNYRLAVSSGDASIAIDFSVSDIASIKMDIVDGIIGVSPTVAFSSSGLKGDPKITLAGAKAQNFTYNGTEYYMIVENSSSVFDTLYIDDDPYLYFNNSGPGNTGKPMMKYLKGGSKVRFGLKDFEVWYIAPNGSEVIFAERLRPVFSAGASQSFNLIVLALNNNTAPVGSAGIIVKTMNDTFDVLDTATNSTDSSSGILVISYTISASAPAGNYYLVANGMAHVSFTLRGFTFTPSVLDAEGNPVYLTAANSQLTLKASVVTADGEPVTSATASAIVTGPAGAEDTLSLTSGSDGTYSTTYTPPAAEGDYAVEFRATYTGDTQTATLRFKVRTYDVFVLPVAGMKGPAEGFAPGQNGSAFVGARNMGTGDFANLSTMTSNCNETKVILKGIFDSTGANKLAGNWRTANITTFLTANSDKIPPYMWNEIKKYFGEGACVVSFTAPNDTGVYELKVNVSSANITGEASSTIGVQDIFVWAYLVSEGGNYQWAVSPGGNVTLAINGYDSVTGNPLSSGSIIDANLVEVFAEEAGMVVTDQMLNESFSGGRISFIANDSVMGHHFVKLKVKANVTRDGINRTVEALGQGWFQEKLFDVWVYPAGENYGRFGSGSTINMSVDVRDMGGSAKEGVTVTLDEVRYSETWETLSGILGPTGSAPSCTTAAASNGSRGGCTLSFDKPSSWSAWKSGGYSLKVKAAYTDPTTNAEVTDYGFGWFEVRSFNFWAWSRDWEVTTNQNITISANVQSFNWTPITATVSVDKILYMGTWENWQPPTVVNASVGISKDIMGMEEITIPAGTLTKQGQYDIVLNATVGGIGTETAHAWVYTKPFTIYVDDPSQNWERRYETNGNVTLNITGFEKMSWYTWPPTGTGHNLSAAWVQSVEKVGKWGTKYKTKQDMLTYNNMTSSCNGNTASCMLTFNLSSFETGEYNLVIKANDSQGNEAESWFWMRVESMRITIPQLLDWVRVYDNRKMDNSTYFAVDDKCGNNDDTPQNENNNLVYNLTDCKYKAVQIVKKLSSQSQNWDYNYTYFMLDRNTSSDKPVFINNTDLGQNPSGVTFNTSYARAKGVNDTFTDGALNTWRISAIDRSGNYLYLESANGTIGSDDGNSDDTYLVKINQARSKSGIFLKNFGDYGLYDQDWMNIDLNGDGEYWSDRYYIVMADSSVAGKYDTVFISNTSDFTNAINATNISNEIKFGGPRGIKLLIYKFVGGANGGANYYKLTFTSNKAGWPGMDLGIYKPDSIVNVPVLVTSPRNESIGIANATVKIAKLIKFGMMGETEVPLGTSALENTSTTGLAIVQVNLSGVQNSEYLLKLEVQRAGDADWTKTSSTWENPRISVRSFVVSGRLGLKGAIGDLVKWNESAGNMLVVMSDQQFGGMTDYMNYRPEYDAYGMGDWEYRNVFYNDTSDPKQIIIDIDGDWNPTNGIAYNYTGPGMAIPVKKRNNNTEFMTVETLTLVGGHNTTVNASASVVDRNYNFTVFSVNLTTNTTRIRIEKIGPWGSWPVVGGMQGGRPFNLSDQVSPDWSTWWYEGFNITEITSGYVKFTWVYPAITLNSSLNMQGTQKVSRIVNLSKIGASGDYELIIYNSPARNTSDDIGGWQWSDALDTVRVINTSGGLVEEYAFGASIPYANNYSVVGARKWDDRVYLSTLRINNRAIYPMPWTCDDNNALYIANFTEKSAGVQMTENQGPQGGEANLSEEKQYYALLRDNDCNGAKQITQAMVDDDPVFDDRWVQISQYQSKPYDFDHAEEGMPRDSWDLQNNQNRSEDYFDIGMERWPFTATAFNGTQLDLFSFRDWTERGQDLFLWVSAKDFDGQQITGNVTVKSIKGWQSSCNSPPAEVSLNVSAYGRTPVANGTAYVRLNMTNMTGGSYTAKFNVTSSQGTYEIVESNFWVNDKSMWETCVASGSGGGSSQPMPK